MTVCSVVEIAVSLPTLELPMLSRDAFLAMKGCNGFYLLPPDKGTILDSMEDLEVS